MKVMVNIQSPIPTSFLKKMQVLGFVYLPSLSYYTYPVCILFWHAIPRSFYIANVFIFLYSIIILYMYSLKVGPE